MWVYCLGDVANGWRLLVDWECVYVGIFGFSRESTEDDMGHGI